MLGLSHAAVGASVEGSTYDEDDAVGQMLPLSNAAADASAILHQIDYALHIATLQPSDGQRKKYVKAG
jgi:hypothetical protein